MARKSKAERDKVTEAAVADDPVAEINKSYALVRIGSGVSFCVTAQSWT